MSRVTAYLIGLSFVNPDDIPFSLFSGTKDGFFLSRHGRVCLDHRKAISFNSSFGAESFILNNPSEKYRYSVCHVTGG